MERDAAETKLIECLEYFENNKNALLMRSTFLQSALNQPTNINGQLQALNQLVLNYAVPQVCGEAESYIKYKSDVSNLAVPMASPTYVSTAGQNTLELKPWF